MFERLRRKKESKDADPEAAQVRKGGRQFKIKVRLYERHGTGQDKFKIFVKPDHDIMQKVRERIEKLFSKTDGERCLKVRLFDGHGAGQSEKFDIYVKAEKNAVRRTREKIEGLFRK